MERNYIVYGLFDKREPEIIAYVGQSGNSIRARTGWHRRERGRRVGMWIQEIGADNMDWVIFDTFPTREEAKDLERLLVREYSQKGEAYLNRALRYVEDSPEAKWHGTGGGYSNHKCRCDACTAAWALVIYRARERRVKSGKPVPEGKHGTEYAYAAYGCRCDNCRDASRIAGAERRARRASD